MPTDYPLAKEKARQQYDAAFHLLNVTYPLVQDQKMLIGIVHNLFSSLESSMDAILAYERQLRLIPAYPENFQSKFNLFRLKSVRRNQIPPQFVNLLKELNEMIRLHKESPMEFQRGSKFVICNGSYRMKSITVADLKSHLNLTKEFLELTEKITRLR